MRAVLDAVKAAIEADGWHVGIQQRPDVPDHHPYVILAVLSAQTDGPIAAGSLDADRGFLVNVKTVGSQTQAMELQDRVEPLVKQAQPDGWHILKAQVEQVSGPLREDTAAPEDSVWWCDLAVRMWVTPS